MTHPGSRFRWLLIAALSGIASGPGLAADALMVANWISPQKVDAPDFDNIQPGASIAIAFNQPIQAGDGNILIQDVTDGSSTRRIPTASSQVTVRGNLLLVNPLDPLQPGRSYVLQILDGAVSGVGAAGQPYAQGESVDFTTAGAGLVMKIIPLQHVWVGTRVLGDEFGTPGSGVSRLTLEGIEKILENILKVSIELKGTDATMKGGDAFDPDVVPAVPGQPATTDPRDWQDTPLIESEEPDPVGFGVTPLPDVFQMETDEARPRLRRRRDPPYDVSGIGLDQMRPGIIADVGLNAIIIVDTPERVDQVVEIVRQLDQPQKMVEISVAFVDLVDRAGFEWESELLVTSGTANGAAAIRTAEAEATLSSSLGGNLSPDRNATQPPFLSGGGLNIGTLIAATRGDAFTIISNIHALEKQGQAQILSRPTLLTLNNHAAALTNTATFHVRVGGQKRSNLFQVQSGTYVQILPRVVELKDGAGQAIDLLVDICEGKPDEGNSVDGIPFVTHSRIQTQAVIRENESLLIAGTYQHSQDRGEGFVPVIGKVPVLGLAFKEKTVNRSKTQRLFLIAPKIIEPDLGALSQRDLRLARMLDTSVPPETTGLELNRENEAQVQDAMDAVGASGGPTFKFLPRLRRAWHTNQNP